MTDRFDQIFYTGADNRRGRMRQLHFAKVLPDGTWVHGEEAAELRRKEEIARGHPYHSDNCGGLMLGNFCEKCGWEQT